VSIGAHLIHRCTRQRATISPDELRQDIKDYSAQLLTDLPCRLVIKTQRIFSNDRAQLVTVTVYKLLLAPGADVVAGDRITDLVYEDGSEAQDAETFAVRAILPRRGRTVRHISLSLERIA